MGALTDVCNVNISLQGAGVTQEGFGTLLCLTPHVAWTDRVREYASAADMLTDGFKQSDAAYQAAEIYFSPLVNAPTNIKIGRVAVQKVAVAFRQSVPDPTVPGTTYTLTINGRPCSYTAPSNADHSQTMAFDGIAAAISAAFPGGDITTRVMGPGSGIVFMLIQNTTGEPWTVAPDSHLLMAVGGIEVSTKSIGVGDYSLTAFGKTATYTAGSNDTEDTILAGLAAATNMQGAPYFAIVADGNTLLLMCYPGDDTIDPIQMQQTMSAYAVSDNLNVVDFVGETVAAALAACVDADSDFYGVMVTTRSADVQLAAAEWIEQSGRLYGTASADPAVSGTTPQADTTSIAAQLMALQRYRTWGLDDPNANGGNGDPWPEAAWFAAMLPIDLDEATATWKFKQLAGVAVPKHTTNQIANLVGNPQLGSGGKNWNLYDSIGGQGITREGKVCAGEWIDIIMGRDWLEARMTEAVFNVLLTSAKVPFTDGGVALVVNQIIACLKTAFNTQFLAFDSTLGNLGFSLTVPAVLDMNPTDRSNRVLKGITWSARVAGAIHVADLNGAIAA
jgi:hypothetical protein